MEASPMVTDDASGTRLLLARHAETAAPDRFHGAESDIGLSDWGLEQAERLGRWLVEASPGGALLLGDAAGRRHGGPDRPRLRLGAGRHPGVARAPDRDAERRLARGRLGDLHRDQVAVDRRRARSRPIPAASRSPTSADRVCPILEDLAARHRGETIVVVAHGVVIRVR